MKKKKVGLPSNVSSRVIEHVLRRTERLIEAKSGHVHINMKGVKFVDPSGMVSLLELFRYLYNKRISITLEPPGDDVYSYLRRMSFWSITKPFIETDMNTGRRGGGSSDVLLEITPIRESQDIHRVLGSIRERAGIILKKYLSYPRSELDRFLTSISEICQNIVEHSGDHGYVAVQKYHYRETLGKNVVKMIVSDLGRGIKNTLSDRWKRKFGSDWSDRVAINQALFKKASRFEDPGRGHGLTSVRKSTHHWNGRLTLRSGTARVSIVPDWDNKTKEVEENLKFFPGTQVVLILPEKEQEKDLTDVNKEETEKGKKGRQKSLFD